MIKFFLAGFLFVILVFFGLNYWEKAKDDKKKILTKTFSLLLILILAFIIFLLYD